MMRLWLLPMLSSLLLWHPVLADETGSDSVRLIREVTVSSRIRHHETITPQTLHADQLAKVGAHSVADALRWMSGVQLKDYGGMGGLKTVNLRSMGSQHVGIYYDGIELGNAQNGVIDLGQFSLDNVEEISVYQGNRSAILQTASDFANAGSIYIRTSQPQNLTTSKPHDLRLKLQTGSFGLLRLSGLYERRLSERVTLSANAEGLTSSGKYRFTYRRRNLDGSLAYDTTATRQNGDVQSVRAEVNLMGRFSEGLWNVKAYTFHSARGIPGAIVNNVWRRGERQSDDNTFVQGSWERDLTRHYSLKVLAKYARYATHYLNRDTTQLMIDQRYRQQEAYASLIQVVEVLPWWSLSLSADGRWNGLWSDRETLSSPRRWTGMASIATAMDLGKVQLQGSVVGSWVRDEDDTMGDSEARLPAETTASRHWSTRCFTPALFVSCSPRRWIQFTGFAKRSFKMPTFNDLYYTEVGNALLEPETALQYDLGIRLGNHIPVSARPERSAPGQTSRCHYSIELHAYHNAVHDKIVAYPKGGQFRWTMLNLGRVHIDGIDLQGRAIWPLSQQLRMEAMLQYTYQRARDVTDPTTSYYGHQIPYTPWHSGSASLMLDYGTFDLAYNFVYTGERYSQQENIRYNHLEPWYTSDMHLGAKLKVGSYKLKVCLEVCNLFDQQYDVIINYPMPGRNYCLTMQCEI